MRLYEEENNIKIKDTKKGKYHKGEYIQKIKTMYTDLYN